MTLHSLPMDRPTRRALLAEWWRCEHVALALERRDYRCPIALDNARRRRDRARHAFWRALWRLR